MPAQHRWIADWIFADADDAFHRNIPVSPEAFHNTLAVQINHQFTEVEAAALCPHVAQRENTEGNKCPVTGMTIAQSPSHRSVRVSNADLLLLPVANLDGITVGYSFGASDHESAGGSTTTRGPPFCGRFAFNSADDDLLMVINGVPSAAPKPWSAMTIIMSVAKLPGKETREHTFITCPKMEYGFEHLPSHSLSVASAEGTPPEKSKAVAVFDDLEELLAMRDLDSLSSTEKLLGCPVGPVPSTPRLFDAFPNDGENSLLLHDSSNGESPVHSEDTMVSDDVSNMDFVQSLIFDMKTPIGSPVRSALTRATPWGSGSYGATSDGVGIPRMPGRSPTSSGAFDMRALSLALGGIAASLDGTYITTKTKPRIFDPVTGRSVTRALLKVVATLERANDTVSAMLQRQAAALYFAAATTIRSDEGRLKAPSAMPVCPLVYGARAVTVVGTSRRSSEIKAREERKEAKKRRNRMSAARSNQRRKEALELRKKGLADLKARAHELQRRKETLTVENQSLKERVYLAGYGIGQWLAL